MRVVLPVAVLAVALAGACTATPDLEYLPGGDDGGSSSGASSGTSGTSGTTSGGTSGSTSGTSGSSGSSGRFDAGQDARGGGDASGDSGDANLACPLVTKTGVACCQGPSPRTCVDQSCQHCSECLNAGCGADQYCCPQINGGGQFKGIVCKPTSGC
jgi:hypothetical protein